MRKTDEKDLRDHRDLRDDRNLRDEKDNRDLRDDRRQPGFTLFMLCILQYPLFSAAVAMVSTYRVVNVGTGLVKCTMGPNSVIYLSLCCQLVR